MTTLGERIRLARGKMSQDAFAKMIQVSKGSLGFYERNENLPNTDVILRICSKTNIALDWLLLGKGPMHCSKTDTYHDACTTAPHGAGIASSDAIQTALTMLEEDFHHFHQNMQATQCPRCSELAERLLTTNEKLLATNEKLVATSERLVATNEKLFAAHEMLVAVSERERLLLAELAQFRKESAKVQNLANRLLEET